MNDLQTATLYGIGVGPGDPELLTLKAARLLRAVRWIYHPGSARHGDSLAAQVIAQLALPEAKFRRVALSMSRQRQDDLDVYAGVASEIVRELDEGQSVAWITEGDPLFYSTFLYVREAVQRVAPHAALEIVPGITSVQAAAARAGIPVARLDEQVAIVPAAYGLEQLPDLLDRFTTIFLLKVHTVMEQLLVKLARLEQRVQAVYLEHVGGPRERIVTDLASLRGQDLPYFSLVILRRRDGGQP